MQLVEEAATIEVAQQYIEGTVIQANGTTLTKGSLWSIAKVSDGLWQMTMTCEAWAQGTDVNDWEQAEWRELVGNAAPVILDSSATVDPGGRLVFATASPQGSTALIMLPTFN